MNFPRYCPSVFYTESDSTDISQLLTTYYYAMPPFFLNIIYIAVYFLGGSERSSHNLFCEKL